MIIKYMPDEKSVTDARKADDPLLLLISHSGDIVIMGNIDFYGEHILMLKSAGWAEENLDDFFRVIATNSGADWTFVAPNGYKGIRDRNRRIETFYNDGVDIITRVLSELKFGTDINIPKRFQRHLDIFKG
jgi:hypothetical protein